MKSIHELSSSLSCSRRRATKSVQRQFVRHQNKIAIGFVLNFIGFRRLRLNIDFSLSCSRRRATKSVQRQFARHQNKIAIGFVLNFIGFRRLRLNIDFEPV